MPRGRRYELDELIIRPGTYFNPQTEVMIVVDDSPSMDSEIFNMEEFEGADWVLISDDRPVASGHDLGPRARMGSDQRGEALRLRLGPGPVASHLLGEVAPGLAGGIGLGVAVIGARVDEMTKHTGTISEDVGHRPVRG